MNPGNAVLGNAVQQEDAAVTTNATGVLGNIPGEIKTEHRSIKTESAPDTEGRVWRGNLHVRGHRNDMVVPCVAVRYPTPHRPSVVDAAGWPSRLHCDSTNLKQRASVFQYMNEPMSQWYVRFAPVDCNDTELSEPKLVQLVKVMVHRQLVFELHCDETSSSQGTLYLWGEQLPVHGHSLLGLFRPNPNPMVVSNKDDEQSV